MKKIKKYWDYYLLIWGEIVTLIILYTMLKLERFENPVNAIIIEFIVTILLSAIRVARFVWDSKKK